MPAKKTSKLRQRLDQTLVARGLVASRSQAASYIKLGKVEVNGLTEYKAGRLVASTDQLRLSQTEQYVSRAGMKLAGAADKFQLDFKNKLVLDVGSSTGGFTDYALRHGASKVIAVDVGTDQMHPKLRADSRVELHEKTDIRDFKKLEQMPDIVTIDVNFISLKEVLPAVADLCGPPTQIAAMFKPQFETNAANLHKGVIKNDKVRRRLMVEFESWIKPNFLIIAKTDSEIAGAKGNKERFYLLKSLPKH